MCLTQQNDDADKYGDDGSRAQPSCHDAFHVHTVAVMITLAHFDAQVGGVGHGQVTRVRDADGQLIYPAFQVTNLET